MILCYNYGARNKIKNRLPEPALVVEASASTDRSIVLASFEYGASTDPYSPSGWIQVVRSPHPHSPHPCPRLPKINTRRNIQPHLRPPESNITVPIKP